jgi:hypothetical protein
VQSEYTYFAIFVLITAFVILTLLHMFRAAKSTISQLNEESRRDRLQRERIAREKHFQTRALRRGTRKIDGRATKVQWDQADRRAQRTYHVDESADEVFQLATDNRGMDVRVPWGWPGSKKNQQASVRRPVRTSQSGMSGFFKRRQVIDDEVRARRERSIRSLVEDRYGRVGFHAATTMSEVEWSKPALPKELIEERKTDQMLAGKPAIGVESKAKRVRGLRVVTNKKEQGEKQKKVSGA